MSSTHPADEQSMDDLKDTGTDPRSLILPDIQTDMTWYAGFTMKELLLYVPAGLALLATGGLILFGRRPYAIVTGLLTFALFTGASWLHADWDPNRPPHEQVHDWLQHRREARAYPRTHDESAPHDLLCGREDHSIERPDGMRLALIPVSGTNTDRLPADEMRTLVGALTDAIDEDIKDHWWSYYCSSRPTSTEALADHREERALAGYEHDLTDLQKETLIESADWLREDDAEWAANDWRDFVLVRAHDEDDPRRDAAALLADRADRVTTAIQGLDGVEADRALLGEAVDLAMDYWAGARGDGADRETLADAAAGPDYPGGQTPLQALVGPAHFDVEVEDGRGYIHLEGEYARTFWIAEWPTQPSEMFLRQALTMQGVQADLKITATPRRTEDAKGAIEEEAPKLAIEQSEREAQYDLSASRVETAEEAYTLGYQLLDHRLSRAWSINGYLTVRAPSKAKLDEDCDRLRKRLEGAPAKCFPIAPATRQADLFASAAPFGQDHYHRNSLTSKRKLAFSGALGAMFPFVAPSVHDTGGIRWGRNTLTGEMLQVDPFDRGTAPHMITVGTSRSGKTYGVSTAGGEWFLDDDDRTLIVCDTQGGFDGLTDLCDGDHIVVDGSRGINPFDIQPVPAHVRRATDGGYNGYRMKVDEVVEFFAAVIAAQGEDPSPYRATIEEAVEQTYRARGITTDPSTHHTRSPRPEEFFDTLGEMLEETERHSHTGHAREIETKQKRIADLLDKLSGFREGGKYAHLRGETETGLDRETEMAYLDLRHLQGQTDADKSVMLHLMLSQVSQLIKRTDGETIFMIDEAHNLLHSEEMVAWLEKAAREWARYDAALWFVTQSPNEFVYRAQGSTAGEENPRKTIVGQCSTVQVFRSSRTAPETLRELGLDDAWLDVARSKLTPGKAGKGYSECLLSFNDQRGWIEAWVEAPPTFDRVNSYMSHKHGDLDAYLADGGQADV